MFDSEMNVWPVLWSNVEPDEDVGDCLEKKKGNNGEHWQEGEEMPEAMIKKAKQNQIWSSDIVKSEKAI